MGARGGKERAKSESVFDPSQMMDVLQMWSVLLLISP